MGFVSFLKILRFPHLGGTHLLVVGFNKWLKSFYVCFLSVRPSVCLLLAFEGPPLQVLQTAFLLEILQFDNPGYFIYLNLLIHIDGSWNL